MFVVVRITLPPANPSGEFGSSSKSDSPLCVTSDTDMGDPGFAFGGEDNGLPNLAVVPTCEGSPSPSRADDALAAAGGGLGGSRDNTLESLL